VSHIPSRTSDALTGDLVSPITRYPGGPVDEPVLAAAKRLGATPAQIILAWVRSKGLAIVTYVLPYPSSYV